MKHAETSQPVRREDARAMRQAMVLSVSFGLVMLVLKVVAFAVTGSAAILSDAAESVVHLLAVAFAAYSLWLSLKPADASHPYGHDRIAFFSVGFEGAVIGGAAVFILWEAGARWVRGEELRHLGLGALLVAVAAILNGLLGLHLVRQGRRYHSLVLEANGRHVLTDCWTSLGVLLSLALVRLTGWGPFDPLVAVLIGLQILLSGVRLMRRSIGGLMDESDPGVQQRIVAILEAETRGTEVRFHNLRHRSSGHQLFVELHLVFPAETSITTAHARATAVERRIAESFPAGTRVLTHLEPAEGHDEAHLPDGRRADRPGPAAGPHRTAPDPP